MNPLRPLPPPTRAWQRPFRLLTYSHDSYGLGHLRRSITLATAMTARGPNVHALCLTGSPVPDQFPLPERCELIKIPAIGKSQAGQYVARRLPVPFAEISRLRADLITATVRSFRPDLLLVDHTATGPGEELLPVLRRLRHEGMHTRVVLGLRDVLDTPERARLEVHGNGTVAAIRSFYDQVLVYGQPEVLDVVTAYDLPADIAAKTTYVGAVVPQDARPLPRTADSDTAPRILVTAGGGEDGFELLRGAIAAVRGPLRARPLHVTVVTGPLMPEAAADDLRRAVQDDPRIDLLRSTRAMELLLDQADLVIGMGGYNTVYEALARQLPLLTLPRRTPRAEQLERCTRLAAAGLLSVLAPAEAADPHRFAAAITRGLAPAGDARTFALRCDGAVRAAALCLHLQRERPVAPPAITARLS
ncbi:MAG: hypothetical protein IPK26_10240 [Planctomycetes bacterium]|nr:hypothetical protein [Planctomycetota bacterium]